MNSHSIFVGEVSTLEMLARMAMADEQLLLDLEVARETDKEHQRKDLAQLDLNLARLKETARVR